MIPIEEFWDLFENCPINYFVKEWKQRDCLKLVDNILEVSETVITYMTVGMIRRDGWTCSRMAVSRYVRGKRPKWSTFSWSWYTGLTMCESKNWLLRNIIFGWRRNQSVWWEVLEERAGSEHLVVVECSLVMLDEWLVPFKAYGIAAFMPVSLSSSDWCAACLGQPWVRQTRASSFGG